MKEARLFVLVAAVAVVGCRKHEYVAANGSTVEIDRSGKAVTIRTKEGTVAAGGESVTLPADFPKDIPLYRRARISAATSASGAAGGGRIIAFDSSDWPDDIAKFYQGKLPGWKTAMDMKTEDSHVLILRSPDGKRSITLSANREALKTVVTLTVTTKP